MHGEGAITVSPAAATEHRQDHPHPQRPWRPVADRSRRPGRTVIRAFAAPVVREIAPRREARDAVATW
jgi:hypothetical protein